MTAAQAERLGAYVLDAGLDARILTLGRGDDYCVRICGTYQWHCFSFDDWTLFAKVRKQRKAARRSKKRKEVMDFDDEK